MHTIIQLHHRLQAYLRRYHLDATLILLSIILVLWLLFLIKVSFS